MRTVVIDRARWHRGKGLHNSGLHMPNGRMCCLGFEALTRGFTEVELWGRAEPHDLAADYPMRESAGPLVVTDADGVTDNSPTCVQLMVVNDSQDITDQERERELTRLGADIGIQFVFEGED